MPPSNSRPPLSVGIGSRIRASFEKKRESNPSSPTGGLQSSSGFGNSFATTDPELLRNAVNDAVNGDAFQAAIAAHLAKILKPSIKSALDTIQPLVEAVYQHEILLTKTNASIENLLSRLEPILEENEEIIEPLETSKPALPAPLSSHPPTSSPSPRILSRDVTADPASNRGFQVDRDDTQASAELSLLSQSVRSNDGKVAQAVEGIAHIHAVLAPTSQSLDALKVSTEQSASTTSAMQVQLDQLRNDVGSIIATIGPDLGTKVNSITERLAGQDSSAAAPQGAKLDASSVSDSEMLQTISKYLETLKANVDAGIAANTDHFTGLGTKLDDVLITLEAHKDANPGVEILAQVQKGNELHASHAAALDGIRALPVTSESGPGPALNTSTLEAQIGTLMSALDTHKLALDETRAEGTMEPHITAIKEALDSHTSALDELKAREPPAAPSLDAPSLEPHITAIKDALDAHTTTLNELKSRDTTSGGPTAPTQDLSALESHMTAIRSALDTHGSALDEIKAREVVPREAVPTAATAGDLLEPHITAIRAALESHTLALEDLRTAKSGQNHPESDSSTKESDVSLVESHMAGIREALEHHTSMLMQINAINATNSSRRLSSPPSLSSLDPHLQSIISILSAHTAALDEIKANHSPANGALDEHVQTMLDTLVTHTNLLTDIKESDVSDEILTALHECKDSHTSQLAALDEIKDSDMRAEILSALHTSNDAHAGHVTALSSIKSAVDASNESHTAHAAMLGELQSRSVGTSSAGSSSVEGFGGLETKLDAVVSTLEGHGTSLSEIKDAAASSADSHAAHAAVLSELRDASAASNESQNAHATILNDLKQASSEANELHASHITALTEIQSASREIGPPSENGNSNLAAIEVLINNIISTLEAQAATLSDLKDVASSPDLMATVKESHDMLSSHTSLLQSVSDGSSHQEILANIAALKAILEESRGEVSAQSHMARDLHETTKTSHADISTAIGALAAGGVAGAGASLLTQANSDSPELLKEVKSLSALMNQSHTTVTAISAALESLTAQIDINHTTTATSITALSDELRAEVDAAGTDITENVKALGSNIGAADADIVRNLDTLHNEFKAMDVQSLSNAVGECAKEMRGLSADFEKLDTKLSAQVGQLLEEVSMSERAGGFSGAVTPRKVFDPPSNVERAIETGPTAKNVTPLLHQAKLERDGEPATREIEPVGQREVPVNADDTAPKTHVPALGAGILAGAVLAGGIAGAAALSHHHELEGGSVANETEHPSELEPEPEISVQAAEPQSPLQQAVAVDHSREDEAIPPVKEEPTEQSDNEPAPETPHSLQLDESHEVDPSSIGEDSPVEDSPAVASSEASPADKNLVDDEHHADTPTVDNTHQEAIVEADSPSEDQQSLVADETRQIIEGHSAEAEEASDIQELHVEEPEQLRRQSLEETPQSEVPEQDMSQESDDLNEDPSFSRDQNILEPSHDTHTVEDTVEDQQNSADNSAEERGIEEKIPATEMATSDQPEPESPKRDLEKDSRLEAADASHEASSNFEHESSDHLPMESVSVADSLHTDAGSALVEPTPLIGPGGWPVTPATPRIAGAEVSKSSDPDYFSSGPNPDDVEDEQESQESLHQHEVHQDQHAGDVSSTEHSEQSDEMLNNESDFEPSTALKGDESHAPGNPLGSDDEFDFVPRNLDLEDTLPSQQRFADDSVFTQPIEPHTDPVDESFREDSPAVPAENAGKDDLSDNDFSPGNESRQQIALPQDLSARGSDIQFRRDHGHEYEQKDERSVTPDNLVERSLNTALPSSSPPTQRRESVTSSAVEEDAHAGPGISASSLRGDFEEEEVPLTGRFRQGSITSGGMHDDAESPRDDHDRHIPSRGHEQHASINSVGYNEDIPTNRPYRGSSSSAGSDGDFEPGPVPGAVYGGFEDERFPTSAASPRTLDRELMHDDSVAHALPPSEGGNSPVDRRASRGSVAHGGYGDSSPVANEPLGQSATQKYNDFGEDSPIDAASHDSGVASRAYGGFNDIGASRRARPRAGTVHQGYGGFEEGNLPGRSTTLGRQYGGLEEDDPTRVSPLARRLSSTYGHSDEDDLPARLDTSTRPLGRLSAHGYGGFDDNDSPIDDGPVNRQTDAAYGGSPDPAHMQTSPQRSMTARSSIDRSYLPSGAGLHDPDTSPRYDLRNDPRHSARYDGHLAAYGEPAAAYEEDYTPHRHLDEDDSFQNSSALAGAPRRGFPPPVPPGHPASYISGSVDHQTEGYAPHRQTYEEEDSSLDSPTSVDEPGRGFPQPPNIPLGHPAYASPGQDHFQDEYAPHGSMHAEEDSPLDSSFSVNEPVRGFPPPRMSLPRQPIYSSPGQDRFLDGEHASHSHIYEEESPPDSPFSVDEPGHNFPPPPRLGPRDYDQDSLSQHHLQTEYASHRQMYNEEDSPPGLRISTNEPRRDPYPPPLETPVFPGSSPSYAQDEDEDHVPRREVHEEQDLPLSSPPRRRLPPPPPLSIPGSTHTTTSANRNPGAPHTQDEDYDPPVSHDSD